MHLIAGGGDACDDVIACMEESCPAGEGGGGAGGSGSGGGGGA